MKKVHVELPAEVSAVIKELGFVYSRREFMYRLDAEGFCIFPVKVDTSNVHHLRLDVWVVFPDEDDDGKCQYSQSGVHGLKFTPGNGDKPLKNFLSDYGLEVDKILRTKRLQALIS